MNFIILSCLVGIATCQQAAPIPIQQDAPIPIQEVAQIPIQLTAPFPIQEAAPTPIQLAAPIPIQQAAPIPIAILYQENGGEGVNFNNVFDSENGIVVESNGFEGFAGQANLAGSYSYVDDNGGTVSIRYIADENGFQPQGDHLPQQVQAIHPVPDHVVELLRMAEEQRAQGIQFDNRGFRIKK